MDIRSTNVGLNVVGIEIYGFVEEFQRGLVVLVGLFTLLPKVVSIASTHVGLDIVRV